jgi:hypothetical protein
VEDNAERKQFAIFATRLLSKTTPFSTKTGQNEWEKDGVHHFRLHEGRDFFTF